MPTHRRNKMNLAVVIALLGIMVFVVNISENVAKILDRLSADTQTKGESQNGGYNEQ